MQLVRPLTQKGETIVEVLIAIAVIGSVLGTSYAIVSRNNKSYQQSNERVEALKLAESQLESVRNTDKSSLSGEFCIVAGTVQAYSDTNCKVGDRYLVKVKKTPSGVAGDQSATYEASVGWESINGSGQDSVSLLYRI